MGQRLKKKEIPRELILAQEAELRQVMNWFHALPSVQGNAVAKLELLVRTAVFKTASQFVGWLLQQAVESAQAAYQPKPGEHAKGTERLCVESLFGSFELHRMYYYHPGREAGHYPADAALGIESGKTPALLRIVCLEGAEEASYQKAEAHLRETGGIHISARQIQRTVQRIGAGAQEWQQREALKPLPECKPAPVLYVSADATGLPMRKEELEGRKGKQPDGTAKTRSAYLGCAFTQHQRDEKGHPVRDYESTTYVSGMEGLEKFGPVLRQEAIRRNMAEAARIVLLIDGAVGLEKMGQLNFPQATQIVDFWHAVDHAGKVVEALLGSREHPQYQTQRSRWVRRLLGNGVENLIKETRQQCTGKANEQSVEEQLAYFVHNAPRMKYRTFRREGLFIGSGVIEAGCKTVIGSRCKQSGMFWGKPGAENVLALRCIGASRRLNAFWTDRLNAQAAANDALALSV